MLYNINNLKSNYIYVKYQTERTAITYAGKNNLLESIKARLFYTTEVCSSVYLSKALLRTSRLSKEEKF